MATKLLGTIFLIGIVATEISAQFGGGYPQYSNNRRYYPQYGYQNGWQRPYQQTAGSSWNQPGGSSWNQQSFQLPPGVSIDNAEWVCKNPKSGDMMIIASEDGPAANGAGKFEVPWPGNNANQPTNPQVNPVQPANPIQPTNPAQVNPGQPSSDPNLNVAGNPFLNPTPPSNPRPTSPQVVPTQPPAPLQTTTPPNVNGEGVIDIRTGN